MSRVTGLVPFLSGWPRRAGAVLCLFAAAATLVLSPHTRPGRRHVLVAAHALPAGAAIGSADVQVIAWPDDAPPPSALEAARQAIGRRTAVTLARGAPIGTGDILESRLAQALSHGDVAMTISLAGTPSASLLQAGSYVDLYAGDSDSPVLINGKSITQGSSDSPLASRIEVLSVLPPIGKDSGNINPTLVISVSRATATHLSPHASAPFLATLVAPP